MIKDTSTPLKQAIGFVLLLLLFLNETVACVLGAILSTFLYLKAKPRFGATRFGMIMIRIIMFLFASLCYFASIKFFHVNNFFEHLINFQIPAIHFSWESIIYIPFAAWALSLWWDDDIENRIKGSSKTKTLVPISAGTHTEKKAQIGFDGGYKVKNYVSVPMILGEHFLIAGRTGCGKTSCAANLIEWAISHGHPVFVIDGKAAKGQYSVFDLMSGLCEKYNKKLNVIDLVNPSLCTLQYNPFAQANAVQKRDMLLLLGEPWSEEHYRVQAANYWTVMCQALEIEGRETTLSTMSKFSNPLELNSLIIHLQKTGKLNSNISNNWISIVKNNGEAAQAASARFQLLTHGEPGQIFACDTNGISARDMWQRDECCLLLLDQSYSDFTARLGGLFLADVKNLCAYANGMKDTKTVLLVCDEIGSYINNKSAGEAILTIYSQGRTAGFIVASMCQSYSDIGGNNDELALRPRLIDNTTHFIVMQMNSSDSAQLMADTIGTRSTVEKTYQIADGLATGKGTYKKVEEYILHPNSIRHLKKNEGYFYTVGSSASPKHFVNRFVDFSSFK